MKEGLNKALIKVANSKLANSTIQKASTAVKNAVKLAKKLAMAFKAVITHIIQILLFFISPIGWISGSVLESAFCLNSCGPQV